MHVFHYYIRGVIILGQSEAARTRMDTFKNKLLVFDGFQTQMQYMCLLYYNMRTAAAAKHCAKTEERIRDACRSPQTYSLTLV